MGSPRRPADGCPRLQKRVEAALLRLTDFPDSGRVSPEFDRLGFREVSVDSHRLFYRVRGDVIWVVGVWHDAQIPNEPQEPDG
jgi:toxin ParE1/3/4